MNRYLVVSTCVYLAILTIIIFATIIEGVSILIVFVFSALAGLLFAFKLLYFHCA